MRLILAVVPLLLTGLGRAAFGSGFVLFGFGPGTEGTVFSGSGGAEDAGALPAVGRHGDHWSSPFRDCASSWATTSPVVS